MSEQEPRAIDPTPERRAPMRLLVEIWPEELEAKATVTHKGKDRDITISAPILRMILAALNCRV